jgi:hypothetical protein
VTSVGRTELQRRLAAEFESRGWDYDLATVPAILDELEQKGSANPTRLAEAVSSDFLARNRATRGEVADVIAIAIADRTVQRGVGGAVQITINDHSHSINVGPAAHVSGTSLNTGSQVAIHGASPKDDVLDAVATLVTAGLRGDWNVEAAEELGHVVEARADVDYEDVRQRALVASEHLGTDIARAKSLLEQIAVSGLGGALGTGIVAALGAIA